VVANFEIEDCDLYKTDQSAGKIIANSSILKNETKRAKGH
jgi:hypothetical protein